MKEDLIEIAALAAFMLGAIALGVLISRLITSTLNP